jgi:alpha-L-arabinofuranosidase
MGLIRWPGGSISDQYHWKNGGTICQHSSPVENATFDNLMTKIAQPLNADIAITLDYGSDPACTGGGLPTEAAAWVSYAKSHGYTAAKYWTVGNEVYGTWEYDLHAHPHDPHTYAAAVHTGYYPDVKAANPHALLGVVGDFQLSGSQAWNSVVFREARPFDFVEIHYYPQYDTDSDSFLLGDAVTNFASGLTTLRQQMAAAGLPKNFPVYLGEFNNDAGNEGKQSVSIVNGIYIGQVIGTLQSAGVEMSTFWEAYGNCSQAGDFSKKLYGWQNFGTQTAFSDGLPEYGCYSAPHTEAGTPFPTARVIGLLAQGIPGGSSVRAVSVPSSLGSTVRAFGYAVKGGYAFALYNNALSSSIKIVAQIQNSASKHFDATLTTYGKSQYDQSKQNRWIGPTTRSLGNVSSSVPLTLPPYSVTLLKLNSM